MFWTCTLSKNSVKAIAQDVFGKNNYDMFEEVDRPG